MKRLLISLTALLLAAGCGGKVVVDLGNGGGSTGTGGGGGNTCTVTPTGANVVVNVCVAKTNGACAVDTLADTVNTYTDTCVSDQLCGCSYTFVQAPCGPDASCCYDVEAVEMFDWCE